MGDVIGGGGGGGEVGLSEFRYWVGKSGVGKMGLGFVFCFVHL